jgi:hypothetical protein
VTERQQRAHELAGWLKRQAAIIQLRDDANALAMAAEILELPPIVRAPINRRRPRAIMILPPSQRMSRLLLRGLIHRRSH